MRLTHGSIYKIVEEYVNKEKIKKNFIDDNFSEILFV